MRKDQWSSRKQERKNKVDERTLRQSIGKTIVGHEMMHGKWALFTVGVFSNGNFISIERITLFRPSISFRYKLLAAVSCLFDILSWT